MPNALAHLLFASLIAIVFVSVLTLPFEAKLGCGLLIVAFSFLPDLDHEKAVARQAYRKIAGIAVFALAIVVLNVFAHMNLGIALVGAFLISLITVPLSEALIPRHRGIMHSLEFAIGVGVMIYLLLAYAHIRPAHIFAAGAFIGYCSHIILDRFM